ncbi:MAG: ABC transporter ATP-binding protein [Rhizobiaceae bacterium]|nr:ABC transporter ATP-binding protein [Rhizobiaceae bacterium]
MSLELKQIVKAVDGETHIHPIDLVLEPGSFNNLLGTTLAGKTSLMQLMAGLEAPTSGEIWFNGKNVTGVAVQKRNVSMVYQQFINYPMMSVYENIASPLRVARYPSADIKKRVGDIAEILRITPMLDRKPSELSGGQQQRTAMARALVKESDLILLDEPLANLDFKLREELRDELPKLFAQRDCVVVYATTEPTEALLLGGHTAAMDKGRVVQFGASSEIYRKPNSLQSARVFSEPPINTAQVAKNGNKITMSGAVSWKPQGKATKLPDGNYTLAVRPHHVFPEKRNETDITIDGTVEVAELSGSESIIHFEAFGQSWVSQSHGVHPFANGEKAKLFVDVSEAFYFDAEGRLAI